jgi:uncharacterized protein YuzE
VTAEVEATYIVIRPHQRSPRQKQIGPGTILDLDEDGNVLGLETIGDVSPVQVLYELLRVVKFP